MAFHSLFSLVPCHVGSGQESLSACPDVAPPPPTYNRPRTIKTRKTRQDKTKLGPVQTRTGPKTCTGCKELQARRHRETDFARPVAIYHHRYHRPSSAPHLQSSACLPERVLANYKELVQGSGWCDDRPATPPPPPMFVLCAHIFVIREVKSHHASFSTTPPLPYCTSTYPAPGPETPPLTFRALDIVMPVFRF